MTKTMTIVAPIMGNLGPTKPFWGCLLNMVAGPVDLMIIDNQPGEEEEEFFEKYVFPFWPGNVTYRPQSDNLGVPLSMQYAYKETDHDILAYMHNDLYVYKHGWDQEVCTFFEAEDKVGLVGFFGAEGIHSSSGRFECRSNMLEAEIHGHRCNIGSAEVAVLDGMNMFASREMLDARDGVDVSFLAHHFYDLDLSCESLDRGFRNYVMFLPIHHQTGSTANQPNFNDWADERLKAGTPGHGQQAMYTLNLTRWKSKWANRLPWQVGDVWKK